MSRTALKILMAGVVLAAQNLLAPAQGVLALAQAQTWPVKPVRFVVPYPASGGVDLFARPLADRLSKVWGQPVLVENKPGGGTIIGAELVARSQADGHVLLFTTESTITSNPHMYPKLPYDPVKDFAAITQLINNPLIVIAHSSVSANTLQELVALARARPGTLNYGSFGSGSQPHLLFEGLKAQTGISLTNVPYKGIMPALQGAVAGEVQLTLGGLITSGSFVKAGRVKPLAIARSERSPFMPEVPTLREAGFPDIDPVSWMGLFAPAGTPRDVVRKIQQDIARIFTDPEFREPQMVHKGYGPVASTPEEFSAFIRSDLEAKAKLIKAAGARAE